MKKRPLSGQGWQLAGWVCLLGVIVLCAGAAEPADAFRFGSAKLGDRLTNQFLLRNMSSDVLEVQSATPSCECVQVKHWTTNVAAGSTGLVEILFTPDRVGEVDYRVYVKTSSPDQPDIEYAVQGMVTSAPRSRTDRNWTLYLGTEESGAAIKDPGGVVWVDVRSAEDHQRIRIPDSLQIPLYAVKTKGFLRDRRVVLVDEGHGSLALERECRKLREMGFSDLSLWYGGLNAWRRRGGVVEGGGEADVNRVQPVALHDIGYSTDWLVVAAGAAATSSLAESVAIPFDQSKKEEFIAALNSAIEARPQVASVLIVTNVDGEYGAIAETADKINAFVFYLEGGWSAWEAHRQMMQAAQHSRTVVSQSTSAGADGVRVRPGGCGGCPK